MIRGMEKMVNFFFNIIFYSGSKKGKNSDRRKEPFILSSVFPSTRVMKEVEKHI